jgi:hypothetical protein
MKRDRLSDIISYLRFDDATTRESRKKYDRLAAISDIIEKFRIAGISNFTPALNVTVDERIVPFKGNC